MPLITVTALSPTLCEAVPTLQLPALAGVAGVLRVRTGCGRQYLLMQDDLLEALVFLAAGSAVMDEEDVLSLDQFLSADGERLQMQLRIGPAGDEVAAWTVGRQELRDDIRRAWAIVEDAAYSWGDPQLLYELHDPGGSWSRHLQAARRDTISI